MTPTELCQNSAVALYCALVPAHAVALLLRRNLSRYLTVGMGLAVAANLMALVYRGIEVQHWPFQTLYEAFLLTSLTTAIGYLLIYFSNGLYAQDRFTSLIANLMGLLTGALCASVVIMAASSDDYKADLPPALQSVWFVPHVVVYIFGYGTLGVAFCASVIYLILAKVRSRRAQAQAPADAPEAESQLARLDNFVYRCIAVGFPFLTMGLIFGALWAQVAWATWWGWDAKEVWSLITWLVYLVYLHLRHVKGWRAAPSAWFIVLGAVAIFITFKLFGYMPASQTSVHKYAS